MLGLSTGRVTGATVRLASTAGVLTAHGPISGGAITLDGTGGGMVEVEPSRCRKSAAVGDSSPFGLTGSQANGSADERAAMSWLAMLKYNAFVFEFAAESLRDKLAARDATLRPSDYETFIDSKSAAHPELFGLKESSRKKVRAVLRRMLTEAGLLVPGDALGTLQRAVPSPSTLAAIRNDSASWLAGFLFSDAEIARL